MHRSAATAPPRPGPRLVWAAGAALAFGLLAGVIWPRGPLTTAAALAVLAVSLPAGWVLGRWAGSRWLIALAPVAFGVGVELSGGGAGPTVGLPDTATSWGVIAAIAGRALWWLVAALPIALGAAFGAGRARKLRTAAGGEPPAAGAPRAVARALGRVAAGLATLVVLLVAWQLLRPASVPPLPAAAGGEAIAELVQVPVAGGAKVWVSLRGQDRDAPIVLYLPGGPGQSDLGLGRALLEPLTEDFVVAILDPRGVGKAYPAFDPARLTTDQAVDDVLTVAAALRARGGGRRLLLVGESGGSVIGVLAVQRAPEHFAAWIGSGQMVAPRTTDRLIRNDLAALLRRRGDRAALTTLRGFGEPPYASIGAYAWIAGYYDALAGDYDPPADYTARGEAAGVGPLGLLASEYGFVDRFGAARGLIDTFAVMYPQWQGLDFRRDVPELRVPVHLFTGDHELAGRREPADAWFDALKAPSKQLHDFANAGHAAAFEHVDALHRVLLAEARRAEGR